MPIEYKNKIKEEILYIPVQADSKEVLIEFFVEEGDTQEKVYEFLVPVGEGKDSSYQYDYLARFPVKKFTDKTILLKGNVPEVFYKAIRNDSLIEPEPLERPSIHFTSNRSWINDPNGVHYKDGIYHLYYQYNPFHIKWNNMSWGHAVSRDLLYWEEKEPVLFPDEYGMIFSGSGIINEKECLGLPKDASLFFYTAAGGSNEWGRGRDFIQRMAYSIDGGNTLVKTEQGMIDTIEKENRDPKVFWHEESQSYVMSLWLKDNEFGILRSKDLTTFEIAQRFSLEGAWECPDLFCLTDKEGQKHWVFWSADGYYYFGTFDGYKFLTDGKRNQAYMNTVPYAAQTYSGIEDRVISISWLRLEFNTSNKLNEQGEYRKRLYTGAMGLPRELKIMKINNELKLALGYTGELIDHRRELGEDSLYFIKTDNKAQISVKIDNHPLMMECQLSKSLEDGDKIEIDVCGINVGYHIKNGEFFIGEERYFIGDQL